MDFDKILFILYGIWSMLWLIHIIFPNFSCVLTFYQDFAVPAATHYHSQPWQTLKHGKDCFILSVIHKHSCKVRYNIAIIHFSPPYLPTTTDYLQSLIYTGQSGSICFYTPPSGVKTEGCTAFDPPFSSPTPLFFPLSPFFLSISLPFHTPHPS